MWRIQKSNLKTVNSGYIYVLVQDADAGVSVLVSFVYREKEVRRRVGGKKGGRGRGRGSGG